MKEQIFKQLTLIKTYITSRLVVYERVLPISSATSAALPELAVLHGPLVAPNRMVFAISKLVSTGHLD